MTVNPGSQKFPSVSLLRFECSPAHDLDGVRPKGVQLALRLHAFPHFLAGAAVVNDVVNICGHLPQRGIQ